MVNITIDGRKISVSEDLTILEAARENGIQIPTLCYNEALKPYGACRICLVELVSENGSKLVPSCTFPVSEGIVVRTDSEEVIKTRKMVLELLLADCPGSKVIKELAEEYGVKKSRFEEEDNNCILCGLCVRACDEIVGARAIHFVDRGYKMEVKPPFLTATVNCIKCGTCTTVCPTGAIKLDELSGISVMHQWSDKFSERRCNVCGSFHFSPGF
ncbi:ferredoxin [candidate division KSB1 bacterium]|nr:MAG: ferredoxin [candidate division KSB1 bacterium]